MSGGPTPTIAGAFERDLNDLSKAPSASGCPAHVRAVRASIDVEVFVTRTVPRASVRHLIRVTLDPVPIASAGRGLSETDATTRTVNR